MRAGLKTRSSQDQYELGFSFLAPEMTSQLMFQNWKNINKGIMEFNVPEMTSSLGDSFDQTTYITSVQL
jgi:hypothetical protein